MIPAPTRTNENGLTFNQWLAQADRACTKICGLGLSDLADGPSWDAWDSDESPKDYAITLLEDEGFPF